jgi:hypothetical protein
MKTRKGDILDAIALAEDSFKEKTFSKGKPLKFERRIVIVTDAEQDFVVEPSSQMETVQSLWEMSCLVEVIGIGFKRSGTFDRPTRSPNDDDRGSDDDVLDAPETENDGESDGETSRDTDGSESDEDGEDDEDNKAVIKKKSTKEQLLLELIQRIGGAVAAAYSLQQMLESDLGRSVSTSTKQKLDLHVAPGFVIHDIRSRVMFGSVSLQSIKTQVAKLDSLTGRPLVNGLGQELLDNVFELKSRVAADNEGEVVEESDTTTAVRYGSSLLPMTAQEIDVAMGTPPGNRRIEILGFMPRERIPKVYLTGPPSLISGEESKQAIAFIAAMAQALEDLKQVAICTFFKTARAKIPELGMLLPLRDEKSPVHLAFLQLPYAGETRLLKFDSFENHLQADSDHSKARNADALINSMMLPDGALESGKVPCPMFRAWNQTKIKRALNPDAHVVHIRHAFDAMSAPKQVVDRATPALEAFLALFPAEDENTELKKPKRGKKRKKVLGSDFLNDLDE